MKKNYTYLTLFSLFIGYMGYYLCRSNLSVATPLMISDLGSGKIDKSAMGNIASWGVFAYAVGKLLNGVIGDFLGGKRIFIIGMVGSIAANIIFGLSSGIWMFTVVWFANRFIQSMGWAGLVKITSEWIDYKRYGSVMGVLSLSYLFGDIMARLVLGQFINWGFDWRALFFISAGMLAFIAVFNMFFLKEKPAEVGLPTPETNPENLFSKSETVENRNILALLLPYFTNFSFILVLLMSFGLTAIRETLNFWPPTYLNEVFKIPIGKASQISSFFLITGTVSIILSGWLSDKLLRGKRGAVIALCSLPLAIILLAMNFTHDNALVSITLLSVAGFFLLGPYSFLAGAMALDFGGKRGAATASGLADFVGYVGGTIAVKMTGVLAEKYSWNDAFLMLSGIAFFTAVVAFVYYLTQERKLRLKSF